MIMVTGGAGYIGSFTVKELLENGYEVLVVDSMESGHEAALRAASVGSLESGAGSRLVLEVADVGDKKRMREIFKKYKVEAVIDFAAYLAVGESMENPKKYMKNNVENFIKLLEVMKEKGCRYIIKSSTASTYGNPDDKYFPLKEDYQEICKLTESALLDGVWDNKKVEGEEFFKAFIGYYEEIFKDRPDLQFTDGDLAKLRIPTSIYGLTKLMDEIILAKYEGKMRSAGLDPSASPQNDNNKGIKSVALRYFNVCGASEDLRAGLKSISDSQIERSLAAKSESLGKLATASSSHDSHFSPKSLHDLPSRIDSKPALIMGEDKPKPTTLMTLVIMNILGKTGKLKVFGDDYPTKDGTGVRDYIHPLDLATGHVKALEYLRETNQSNRFNLGTGNGYTVMELIDEVEKASGRKVEYEVAKRRPGDPAISYANVDRAKEILGWRAKYKLTDMAKTAWEWHSRHPEGYGKIQTLNLKSQN